MLKVKVNGSRHRCGEASESVMPVAPSQRGLAVMARPLMPTSSIIQLHQQSRIEPTISMDKLQSAMGSMEVKDLGDRPSSRSSGCSIVLEEFEDLV